MGKLTQVLKHTSVAVSDLEFKGAQKTTRPHIREQEFLDAVKRFP
jgi:hypothetical protein